MPHQFLQAAFAGFLGLLMSTTLCGCANAETQPKRPARYGSVIGLRAEKLDEYKKLHAAAWPQVTKMITQCNIRNYSIYLRKLPDGNYYLFSYFEYIDNDFKTDMATVAADPTIKKWWALTDPCQQPLPDRDDGQWWAPMEEVFHQD